MYMLWTLCISHDQVTMVDIEILRGGFRMPKWKTKKSLSEGIPTETIATPCIRHIGSTELNSARIESQLMQFPDSVAEQKPIVTVWPHAHDYDQYGLTVSMQM